MHKAECKVFKRVQAEGHGVLPTPVRALVQMLLRADLRAAAAEMESHVEVYRNNNVEWKDMELQALASLHYLDQDATPKRLSEALELLCKASGALMSCLTIISANLVHQLQVNSFSRTDEDIGQTGIFANPALAMANHSCIPNAIVQFIGRKAFLRANVTIKEGEAIEISYIGRKFSCQSAHQMTAYNHPCDQRKQVAYTNNNQIAICIGHRDRNN